jgi:hypothetical protein
MFRAFFATILQFELEPQVTISQDDGSHPKQVPSVAAGPVLRVFTCDVLSRAAATS